MTLDELNRQRGLANTYPSQIHHIHIRERLKFDSTTENGLERRLTTTADDDQLILAQELSLDEEIEMDQQHDTKTRLK
jgi:hypothetical protein